MFIYIYTMEYCVHIWHTVNCTKYRGGFRFPSMIIELCLFHFAHHQRSLPVPVPLCPCPPLSPSPPPPGQARPRALRRLHRRALLLPGGHLEPQPVRGGRLSRYSLACLGCFTSCVGPPLSLLPAAWGRRGGWRLRLGPLHRRALLLPGGHLEPVRVGRLPL